MKLAIAGSSGKVGRRVVKLALERGYDVLAIDLSESPSLVECPWLESHHYDFKRANLQDFDTTIGLLQGCNAVVNLAAYPNPTDYKAQSHNSNVVISWNILRACAELGINRVAQASSVNVITMVYSKQCRFRYFPIDEDHPCEPDEPYGLSKVICEMQADTIARRYDKMRIASLRLHWSLPAKSYGSRPGDPPAQRAKDLWGWVQEDSVAHAFLLALQDNERWSGHERFFIASPETTLDIETLTLIVTCWPDVPIRKPESLYGTRGLFDCSKAANLLGWQHGVLS